MKRRHPNAAKWFTATEEAELRQLVGQAFDVRDTPYLREAVEAIEVWQERTAPDRLARKRRIA